MGENRFYFKSKGNFDVDGFAGKICNEKKIFDPKDTVDAILKKFMGVSLEKVQAVIFQDGELTHLNKYRDALGLWEEHTRDTNQRIIATIDGRDTAGKGSNITRVTKDLKTGRWKIIARGGIPDDELRYKHNWFDEFLKEFPIDGNIALFDRSWYNRAFVEAAMGFCTEEEYNWFMTNINDFEREQITKKGIDLIKVYLSIPKEIQKERLALRKKRKRKGWKSSPVDEQAQERRNYYTLSKKNVLEKTDTKEAPWLIIDSTNKERSATEIIKRIIRTSSDELTAIIENDLSIDLSPDLSICRSASEELARMEEYGDFKKMKENFIFTTDQREYSRQYELNFDGEV